MEFLIAVVFLSIACALVGLAIGYAAAVSTFDGSDSKDKAMLMLGMIVLGLATFAAMLGFVALCDRV